MIEQEVDTEEDEVHVEQQSEEDIDNDCDEEIDVLGREERRAYATLTLNLISKGDWEDNNCDSFSDSLSD